MDNNIIQLTNMTEEEIMNLDLDPKKHRTSLLHGLTSNQFKLLVAKQGGKCALSNIPFYYDKLKRKILDINKKKRPCIDHDHNTGFIRGILSEKPNFLERQWDMGSYGDIPKPQVITIYQRNPPAFEIVGKMIFK